MFPSQSDLADRAAALAERASGPRPESWRPDKPELEHPNPLVGALTAVVEGPDRGYGRTHIAELVDVDGRAWAVWLLGHVLRTEFLERASAPQPGELVAIFHEGRKRRQGARAGEPAEYEAYRVVVERGGQREAAQEPSGPRPFAGVQEPLPPDPSEACDACGMRGGLHAAGCPLDAVPF